ncbi:hypothetical protein TNCV_1505531 [Trichonephila clavipes]|nr:hypothetical protein TNCV_1505531 [Trichonephila clavipes]
MSTQIKEDVLYKDVAQSLNTEKYKGAWVMNAKDNLQSLTKTSVKFIKWNWTTVQPRIYRVICYKTDKLAGYAGGRGNSELHWNAGAQKLFSQAMVQSREKEKK